MANRLSKVEFAEDLLHLVTGFNCGDEEWAREVADWIQKPLGEGGALDELADRQTHPLTVWLHFNENDELVGFSSLTRFNGFMMPSISLIPNLAVAKKHQGKGYISDIMGHLVAAAQAEVANGDCRSWGYSYTQTTNARSTSTKASVFSRLPSAI